MTGVIGLGLKKIIEDVILGHHNAEVEDLFGNLPLMSLALAAAGILILWASRRDRGAQHGDPISLRSAAGIGAVQGLCLPFRGFSRSGATISTGLLMNCSRHESEQFSFALAVILTPPVLVRQILRLLRHHADNNGVASGIPWQVFMPGLVGMLFSFAAGWIAIRWLSSWLESGKWAYFGYYCLLAAAALYTYTRFL